MISRLSLIREIFRTGWAKLLTGGAIFIAFYQFACDQFGFPTLPNLWGMTGAAALPWWAWLLLAQLGAFYGLFEYVRRAAKGPALVGGAGTDFANLANLAQPADSRPSFASPRSVQSKWKPDISLKEALIYLGRHSTWAARHRTLDETMLELRTSLHNAQITAWGKAHPDDEELFQIAQPFWNNADMTIETNYAFSKGRSVAAYDVKLSKPEIEMVWPPKDT